MRLKSYFVHTMEEALQAAKAELGEDAMLVSSKSLEAPPGGRARLEVIFATSALPMPPPKVAPPPPADRRGAIVGLQQFRGELTTLLDVLNRKPDATRLEPLTPARPQLEAIRARLLHAEVPATAVDEILHRCTPILEGLLLRANNSMEDAEQSILPILAAEWKHNQQPEAAAPRVLAFIGATGAGKTSAIAKLAFRLGVSRSQPLSVLSIDNLRIGASDQLAHICSLLGVPFQSLDFSGLLGTAVSANPNRGVILVDTPGYGPSDLDVMQETAFHLGKIPDMQCHLVLPATQRYSEMSKRWNHFAGFRPSRLLFTRLDETEFVGPAWAFARSTAVPVDWVSTGPGIPEDIAEADPAKFAAAMLGQFPFSANGVNPQPASHIASAASVGSARI
jgi:flagellar biosynthesis protein FlhF